jgi:hypothetical protein
LGKNHHDFFNPSNNKKMKQMLFQFQRRQLFQLIMVFTTLFSLNSHLCGQTQNDTLLIRETVLNYLEGLNDNDVSRVEKAMHPELAKRIIVKDKQGNYKLDNMGWSHLLYNIKTVDFTKFYKADANPEEPYQVEVIFFDISNDIATVKAIQNKFAFFDYIHLGKINGEWKIINILWAWI